MNQALSTAKPASVNYAQQLREFLEANSLGRKEVKDRVRDYAARTAKNASEARSMAGNMMKETEFPIISEKVFKRLTAALAVPVAA